jgi:hypothetical protein
MFHAGLLMASDRVAALLAEAPGLGRASQLDGPRLPTNPVLEQLLPDNGLRPGTSTQIRGAGATTIALALVAAASRESWVAVVGMPWLGLCAADELGVDLDHLVVIPDPKKRWTDVLGAVIDAFDIVVCRPQLPERDMRKISGRIRERDAVFVTVGAFDGGDVRIDARPVSWHGIEDGHGHLAARRIDVHVTGRRSAALGKRATLWLPDRDGNVSLVEPTNVVRLAGDRGARS